MDFSIESYIKKLIDIASIKQEYLFEIIEDPSSETKRVKRLVMTLDEEFLACLDELKDEAGIESIAELDANRYSRLRDLKYIVEEISAMEDRISRSRTYTERNVLVR